MVGSWLLHFCRNELSCRSFWPLFRVLMSTSFLLFSLNFCYLPCQHYDHAKARVWHFKMVCQMTQERHVNYYVFLILRFCMCLHPWPVSFQTCLPLSTWSISREPLLLICTGNGHRHMSMNTIDLFLALALKELILQLGEMVSKQITQTMTTIMMLQ